MGFYNSNLLLEHRRTRSGVALSTATAREESIHLPSAWNGHIGPEICSSLKKEDVAYIIIISFFSHVHDLHIKGCMTYII